MSLSVEVLLAHFFADFMLQHRLMAERKWLPGTQAHFWCTFHVLVYSTVVTLVVMGSFDAIFFLGVAIPHWLMDRYSFAYHWMRLIDRSQLLHSSKPRDAAFGGIIYVVIDQTGHITSLYAWLRYYL